MVELDISYSAISATALLDMCRASPLLKKLRAWGPNLSQHLENNTDEFAIAVSGYCPLLEDVTLHLNHPLSKAESYQMHFPKTRSLRFQSPSIGNTVWNYEPTRYDKIEESARTELLDNRAPRKGTYLPTYEIEVFDEYGPWKADSYHYSNT